MAWREGACLLDDFMPESDVRASYATRIAAPPERVYACLRTADFDHWGLTRALYALRALPALAAAPRETWRRFRAELRPHRVTLDDVLAGGFTLLVERPGEELVLGTVGRFWRPGGETRPISPADFREPAPEGTAKAAWNFAVGRRLGRLRTPDRDPCLVRGCGRPAALPRVLARDQTAQRLDSSRDAGCCPKRG
jgi:hypothetical protein